MSGFSQSLLAWGMAVIALFWFVGAHNRLVRLRSAALQAYAALDAQLIRQLDFVQAAIAGAQPQGDEPGRDAVLQAATGQTLTLLQATRQKPLDPQAIAALRTALHVLLAAWQRLHPGETFSFDADGTLSRPAPLEPGQQPEAEPPAPSSPPMAWPEPSALIEITRAQFNAAVAQYNTAIGEFPALLVAWLFQLRPAAGLN